MRNLLLCLVTACSSGGNSDHTKSCKDGAAARCARLMSCSATDFSRRYSSMDECVMRIQSVCLNSFAAPQTSNSDDREEACATALASQDCQSLLNGVTVGACLPSPGPRADSQPCAFSGQCSSGYCYLPDGSNCGTCAPVPKAGDACGDCGVNGLVCSNGVCVEPVALAGACTRMGAPCVGGSTCVGGGFGMMMMGTCQANIATAGAACDTRGRTAAACSRDAGLVCQTMGTGMTATAMCVAITYAADGMPCGNMNGMLVQCMTGACYGAMGAMTPGTCKAPVADGMPCDTVNGPGCMVPARCVGTETDAGTTGTCQLAGATSC